jgi:multidrug efflux pump subunit AcrA (membrane-fusion protein)
MRSRRIVIILVVIIAAAAGWYYYGQQQAANSGTMVLSGTIEATEINLPTVRGGSIRDVYAQEGDKIEVGQRLVDIHSEATNTNERITAPIDGVVLERLVEPEEFAPPGSTVMVISKLDDLTLKVYVPENRYGQIELGQSYPVSVDSFPGETFQGKVTVISDKAEFTPRNVQTKDSRQTTVYAVKLALEPSGGKLKPGMPADVTFTVK